MPVRARLDTQCETGNWISKRLVEDLNRTHEIIANSNPPFLIDGSGHRVISHGSIWLDWKWTRGGTTLKQCEFYIFPPGSDHLDVIFGAEFIKSEKLFSINEGAFLPLVKHRKETDGNITPSHCSENCSSLTLTL